MNLRSAPRTTISACCAAAKPSRLSANTVSTELINFFTLPSRRRDERPSFVVLQNAGQATGKLLHQVIDLAVSGTAAEIRQMQRDTPLARNSGQSSHSARMRAGICL